jgi:hypothetical protein
MTYIGRIPTTDVEFDRNTDESSPFSFPLGMGRVIKGWDLAVATMKKGEEAVLTIQPEYGYGKVRLSPLVTLFTARLIACSLPLDRIRRKDPPQQRIGVYRQACLFQERERAGRRRYGHFEKNDGEQGSLGDAAGRLGGCR